MGLYVANIYRSPNIGVFLKANDQFLLVPKGFAESKSKFLADSLQVSICHASVGGSRLLGPLVVMNNRGVLVSRMAEDYELREIASVTGLRVERLLSKYTAVGNLVAANDRGALVSPLLEANQIKQVKEVLGVEAEVMTMDQYLLVGALVVATDSGAAVYPNQTDNVIAQIGNALGVQASPSSVNGGIPYVASGLVANSKNALVGNLTTGPELVFLTKALNV